jgi:hypothetical protein
MENYLAPHPPQAIVANEALADYIAAVRFGSALVTYLFDTHAKDPHTFLETHTHNPTCFIHTPPYPTVTVTWNACVSKASFGLGWVFHGWVSRPDAVTLPQRWFHFGHARTHVAGGWGQVGLGGSHPGSPSMRRSMLLLSSRLRCP